uniref:Tox-SGS domain-containing protein n=1 Tax=Anopheles farauti TaxID=69004 RepID=A0A182QKX6_9DIPT
MAEEEQVTSLRYSLELSVHSVTKVSVDDFVEVKHISNPAGSVFVRKNRALLVYEKSMHDGSYMEVYAKEDLFTHSHQKTNYHWDVYANPTLLLVRNEKGIEVYQWTNSSLTLQYTISNYHDISGYGASNNTILFGKIFPSDKHIGIVSRLGSKVKFHSLELNATNSTTKELKRRPVLDDVWKQPTTVISLVEHLDAKKPLLSIAVRSASTLQLFRFDDKYELKNIATIIDFPPVDHKYDLIKFAKFNQTTTYNDLLHFSTNGLLIYRYNETVSEYQKMYYSTAFSKLRGWDSRTVETITIMDVNADGYDELLFTGPAGLNVQQAYATPSGFDLRNALVEPTANQSIRYALLKRVRNTAPSEAMELFLHTPEGLATVGSKYEIITETTPKDTTKPAAPTKTKDPVVIPEVVPHHYHAGWLHDQLDLGSLLQPFNPHSGAVELMFPIIDTRVPLGIPMHKIIQYKNVNYNEELGRGWSFPLEYIMLDRQMSGFARDHVYSLVKENQRILLVREPAPNQTPSSPPNGMLFTIDGYPDVKFMFYEKQNFWKVTIDKRELTYTAIKEFETTISCPTWPLCGTLSTATQSYPTRWYLATEQDTTTGIVATYTYNLIKNETDIRLESIKMSDDTSIALSYAEDRITGLKVLMHQYTQDIGFHYSADKEHLQSITQDQRKLFDFEYGRQHKLSKIIYPNGAEWTPKYANIDINPIELKKSLPIGNDTNIFYGPDYVVIVDANLADGRLVLHMRDPLGGTSTTKTDATATIHRANDVRQYMVYALQNMIVVIIIYGSYKEIAILKFANDSWKQQKDYYDFPMDGIISAGNTFVVLYDKKTLSLLTIGSDQQLHEQILKSNLHDNFVVKAFPQGYATYENGKLEINFLNEKDQWVSIDVPPQSINFFQKLDHFINSFDINRELSQSIRRGLLGDMLGVYRQAIAIKSPVLDKGELKIHVRFFTIGFQEKPSICVYYTTMIPYTNMDTFTYTVATEEKDTFTLAYRFNNSKYHLYVKKSDGPHAVALYQYQEHAKKQAMNSRASRQQLKVAERTFKRRYWNIYKSVREAIVFALDLSLFGMLTNQEGVLTGNHQITYDGKHWAKKQLDEDSIRLRKVNQTLTAEYRLLKANATDTFKIVSNGPTGATMFDTKTTKSEEIHLITPHFVQAQPKNHPLTVYFFENKRTVTFPSEEKLNRASNPLAIVTTLRANDTSRFLLFRGTKYFLDPKLTVLGGQTLKTIDGTEHSTAYMYDEQDLELTVDGAIYRKIKIVPGSDTTRYGWYEQSLDLQTGDTVRKTYASDGREVINVKLREQEEKRRQSEYEEPVSRSYLERMIMDINERLPIVDLGPYRLADEMVSYYGFEKYETNHYGQKNRWHFNETLVQMHLNNRFLSLEQPDRTLTGNFTPTDPLQKFVVSCWLRSQHGDALQLGDTVDTLTVTVLLMDGGEKKMTSKPAEVKQRIGDWSYIETIIDTTHFPPETKLTFTVLVAPTTNHRSIAIDHIRFAPLGLPFQANIYEPSRGELSAVLGSTGLMKHYFHNGKGKKTVIVSEHGTVQKFTMESKNMYARESRVRPSVVEMTPRRSGWFAKYGIADICSPRTNVTKTFDSSWSTLGLRFRYSLSQDAQGIQFFWCSKEFNLPCGTASCPPLPKQGEVLIFVTASRISVWLDGVLTQEVLLNDVKPDAEREFRLQCTGDTNIHEFIEMYDARVKVTYHNLAGQPTQVLIYDDPRTLRVREVLYDEIERPVLQTKWTKVHKDKDQYFAFIEDFVKSFDNKTLILTGQVADLNPACDGFPYTQTMYGNDPTEDKQMQGLPGKDYTVHGKYKRTYATRPSNKLLGLLFPENEGFYHKTVYLPGGAMRVTIEDSKGKKVARFSKVGNYEDRLSTWRYGQNNKLQQELPPMYHATAHTSTTANVSFFSQNYANQSELAALQRQWEVRYDYDDANNVIRKRTPDGGIYRYLYDKHGILRFTVHKDHNETVDRAIYFTYVADDKVSREALVHLNETECIRMTNSGQSPESTDFIETLYGEQDDDPNVRYRSQFATRRIGEDQMTEYLVFNQEKRLLQKVFVVNTINESYSINYEYENDKIRSVQYPTGGSTELFKFIYDYNGNGEIASIRESAIKEPLFEFTYNADGMVETMKVRTDPNHTFQRNFKYNEPGFLVELEDDYLTESVSYLETESYGQDSYTPIYEGLISKTLFTAHWHKAVSPLRNGIYQEYFITKGMERPKAALCMEVLKRAKYIDENNLVNRTFYGDLDDDLPFVCGNPIPVNHLSEVLSSRSFPHQYGHRYDYDDHDQLIKAKYFHGLEEMTLAPLTPRSFSKEIQGIDDEASQKIWDALRAKSFITLDCTNRKLCHGREGIKSIFADFIHKHPHKLHLKRMFLKVIAKNEILNVNTFEEKCKRWIEGSYKTTKTCANLKEVLDNNKIFDDRADNSLPSLHANFKDALKEYNHIIHEIVRVLGQHFAKALGRSAGDVQSYEIDANGNHRKFYTGFTRYRLEYRAGTNQITKLYRRNFGRIKQDEEEFTMLHDSDGAVIQAKHKQIKNIEYDKLLHRVNKIEMTDGRTVLYQYDVRAERTFKQVLDKEGEVISEKYYIRDTNGLVLVDMDMTYLTKDQPPDVRMTSYIYKDQQLVGFMRNDKLYGVITDHEGSVRLVVRNGEVVAAYDYLPYGQIFRRFGTDLDGQIAYLYTSQEWEPETGLYNYRARLYDPDIGRFYQTDPKEQYPSPYVYAGNSPVALIDPDGELAFAISCIIMAIIGAYIGAATAAQSWNPLQWNWKSTSLWLGMIGGALTGLSIPFNMTASVSYFVGLGLSLPASIAVMVSSGITFGYFALAAASGSWNPKNFDLSSPGTWNALLGGIATSAFIVTNPKSLITTFQSISSALGRALFVTTNIVLTVTFGYLFGVLKFGGEFDATKWDFTDPGVYFALFEGYTTATMGTVLARNLPSTIKKFGKKMSTGLDRLAETDIYFRAKRLMKGDWSSKLSNAKVFLAANAQAITNLKRGALPVAFYCFFVGLRMADSFEKSPVPGISIFLHIVKTAVITRGFSNRVVKPLIPKRLDTDLRVGALQASKLVGDATYSTSGAETFSNVFSYFHIPFEWFWFFKVAEQHDTTVPQHTLVVKSTENYKNHNKRTSKYGTIKNCYLMSDENAGNGYYVSCFAYRSLVSIYPKDETPLLSSQEDRFHYCHPLTYNGMPSISCDGEKTTLFATQTEPPKLFDFVDSWLLLARVAPAAIREGKRIFKRIFYLPEKKENSKDRTMYKEIMEQAMFELQGLSNKSASAGHKMDWFTIMLEDIREDVNEYLSEGRGNANILLERLSAMRVDAMEEIDLYLAREFATKCTHASKNLQRMAPEWAAIACEFLVKPNDATTRLARTVALEIK